MASNLKVIFLFLWSLQYGGGQVNVQQRPPIRVALLKEEVSIPCKVTFPYIMKYTKFSVFYYWINLVGKKTFIYSKSVKIQIPPGEENRTTTQSYNHKTTPLESTSFTGTYYCEVKWDHIVKVGSGVFVLARDTGYIQTSYRWEILITLTTLLAALSITGTALLLWKRKVVCPGRNQLQNILRHEVETQPPPANPAPATPIYDCLDSQQVDVYSVLGSNTDKPPCRRSPPGKTPKKQETLEESFDTLYENI